MIELVGKYNTAKVYTDNVDAATMGQVIALLNQESIKDSQIRIMPDCHAGAGCVIGTTMTIHGKVIPNLVGVDIGCGMYCVKLTETSIDLPKLDSTIYKYVPSGFDVRETEHKYCKYVNLEKLKCGKNVNMDRAYKSLGTLGGGNHFIEVDEDELGNKYLVIHTGSRYLGKQVAEYYQNAAYECLQQDGREAALKELIETMKKVGRKREIQKAVEEFKWKNPKKDIPKALAYCEDGLFDDYIHDMKIVQEFATWNRKAIADVIIKEMHLHMIEEESFTTIHNYIDTDAMILRKGSVSAKEGEILLIPINMRDGSLLCKGKGNPDWNFSAPHGAGRICSRGEAKERFTVHEFKKTMNDAGIYTTSVGVSTLDEAPMVYKPMDEIVNNIKDTVEILKIIRPVYNFKAGNAE